VKRFSCFPDPHIRGKRTLYRSLETLSREKQAETESFLSLLLHQPIHPHNFKEPSDFTRYWETRQFLRQPAHGPQSRRGQDWHCERSEAIFPSERLDCFVSLLLAMTLNQRFNALSSVPPNQIDPVQRPDSTRISPPSPELPHRPPWQPRP
jgi:hypothetical protein